MSKSDKTNSDLSENNQIMGGFHAETADSCRKSLYITGGAAALISGVLFLISAISFIISCLWPAVNIGWLSLIQCNWLIVIFKLLAGFSGAHAGLLHVLNLLDIFILALVGITCLGLFAALRKLSKIWSIIALAIPFLGIILFIATKVAGRSAVMAAVLVISFVMQRSNIFGKLTIYIGIFASMLLLVGDINAGIIHSNIIVALFGTGYVLLTTWFFLIAQRLFQLCR
jgi:hypothetical protein